MSKIVPLPLVLAVFAVTLSGCGLFGKGKMHERYLDVRMSPAETFDKVLAALEQAQIATIGDAERDEHRVELRFEVTEERKRWWWKDGTHTNTIRRTVHVLDDAIGSRIVIEDGSSGVRIDDEYAQRALSALRDRINWE